MEANHGMSSRTNLARMDAQANNRKEHVEKVVSLFVIFLFLLEMSIWSNIGKFTLIPPMRR